MDEHPSVTTSHQQVGREEPPEQHPSVLTVEMAYGGS